MTGSISSLLASSDKYRDKMVLVMARSGETELKFSSPAWATRSRRRSIWASSSRRQRNRWEEWAEGTAWPPEPRSP